MTKESAVVKRVRREHAHGLRNLARCLICESAIVSVSRFSSIGVITGEEVAGCFVEFSEVILSGERSRDSMLRLRLSALGRSVCFLSLLCLSILTSAIFSA